MRFACPCCGVDLTRKEAKNLFWQLEARLGQLPLTSAYRCPKHNTEIGGTKSSKHMLGVAFDILTPSKEEQELLIKEALKLGFKGIGRGSTFTHIDLRRFPAYWTYTVKNKAPLVG